MNTAVEQSEEGHFLRIYGDHVDGKSNNDVESVTFINQVNTEYLTTFTHLNEKFPNFKYLQIVYSELNGISSQNLKHFRNLENITIDECKVASLPSDLFTYNKKLKYAKFKNNLELIVVGKDIFNNLPNLQTVTVLGNNCFNEHINSEGRNQIDELSARLSTSSCVSQSDRLEILMKKLEKNVLHQNRVIGGLLEKVNQIDEKLKGQD